MQNIDFGKFSLSLEFVIPICLVILTALLSYRQSPCHTERSEVSTKSKCALNSMDFSLSIESSK